MEKDRGQGPGSKSFSGLQDGRDIAMRFRQFTNDNATRLRDEGEGRKGTRETEEHGVRLRAIIVSSKSEGTMSLGEQTRRLSRIRVRVAFAAWAYPEKVLVEEGDPYRH